MAIIECRECGREVSSEAKVCPGCGASPSPKKEPANWGLRLLGAVMVAFLLFVSTAYYVGKRSSEEARNSVSKRMAELGHPEAYVLTSKYTDRGHMTYTCLSAHYAEGGEDRIKRFIVMQTGAFKSFLGMEEEGEKSFNSSYADVCA